MPEATMENYEQPTDLRSLVQSYERQLLLSALAAAGGNQRRAARSLGVLPTTFHEKLKRLGLTQPRTPDALESAEPG